MNRIVIPAARGEGDVRPDGSYCVNNTGVGIETNRGRIPLPPGETDIRYPALAADGRIAGQPQTSVRGAWVWSVSAGKWTTDSRIPASPNPVIFDNADVLHVNQLGPSYAGSQGYQYVAPDGSIVPGQSTYAAIHNVAEWIDLSDAQDRSLLIGYANWDYLCIVWDGVAGVNRLLEPGQAWRLRARRQGEQVAIAITHADGCVLLQTTRAELRTLPVVSREPQHPPPLPIPPEPTPVPVPTPAPTPEPPVSNFDPSAVQFVDSPGDMASWRESATITSVRFDNDRFQVDHSGRATWPDLPFGDGSGGTVQYTLGVCCFVGGKWVGSAVVQFWKGRELTAGGGVSTFAQDWFYDGRWGALQGHQPQPGELIAVFAAAGNDRGSQNPPVGDNRQRTDFALVKWGQPYTADAPAPTPDPPAPDPTPTPTPVPTDDPRFSILQAEIDSIKAQIAALPPPSSSPAQDLSGYAKKGDSVTSNANLPFFGKVTVHGTIDK